MTNDATLAGNFTVTGSQSLTIGGTATQTGSRTITNNQTAGFFRIGTMNLAEAATARTLNGYRCWATQIGTVVNTGANNVITNNSTGGLTIDTNVFLSEGVGVGRTLNLTGGTGNTVISGNIANYNGVGGVAGNIVKTGTGSVTLSGTGSTYTGTMTVNNGTVFLGANGGFSPTASFTINGNAAGLAPVLDLAGFNGSINNLTFGGTGQTATSSASVTTGTGTLTLNGNVTTSATGNPTTSASFTGNLQLATGTRTFNVAIAPEVPST